MLKKSGARWHDLEVSVGENSSFFSDKIWGLAFSLVKAHWKILTNFCTS